MKKIIFLIIAVVIAGVLFYFFGGREEVISPNNQEIKFETGVAVVDEVAIEVLDTEPVRVNALVKGSLPDSCTTLSEIKTKVEEKEFKVAITTKRPEGSVCAQVIVPFEEIVPLSVEGLLAGDYIVDVNGVAENFTLLEDN